MWSKFKISGLKSAASLHFIDFLLVKATMKDIHTLSVTISHYITLSLHYHCHGRNPIHTRFGSRRHFVLTLLRGRGRIHHTLLVAEGRSLRFWKGQMGQILLEMLWGLEYSIFFIILMISMCFLHLSITMISRFWLLPRSWSWDPGHCLRIFCYYPSWRVPLYIVDGCTYFNVYMLHIYICIYIYIYIHTIFVGLKFTIYPARIWVDIQVDGHHLLGSS